jgi:hypothetical protein
MERPTFDYIKRLGSCWSAADLADAVKAANTPDDPSWAWFLGSRLAAFGKRAVLDRVLVALQHVHLQRIALPQAERAGQLWRRCQAMSEPELMTFAETLGVFLDSDPQPATAPTHGD